MMKRNKLNFLFVLLMCGAVTFSSCIGNFRLSNNLLSWNKSIGGKFVNELVFFLFWVIPVYEITILADILVLNSIEFWSGSNPIASDTPAQRIEGEKGNYLVQQHSEGYSITCEESGDTLELVFDSESRTWRAETSDYAFDLFSFTDDQHVIMYLPNGETLKLELSQSGMMDFKTLLENHPELFSAR